MAVSKYAEMRTLVRRMKRLPDDNRATFKGKIQLLHKSFKEFNRDVSEICQWLMGVRPDGKRASQNTQLFWKFFLEPKQFYDNSLEIDSDWVRLSVFRVVSGMDTEDSIAGLQLDPSLVDSIHSVILLAKTKSANNIHGRLAEFERSHQMVLLKATAEWVISHYQNAYENWKRQYPEWEKEKKEWERTHPKLTDSIRKDYNKLFQKLKVTRKRPRICSWQRLENFTDNCEYAGEEIKFGRERRRHSALCKKFCDFLSKQERSAKRFFVKNAKDYLSLRQRGNHAVPEAMTILLQKTPPATWFENSWKEYLKALNITEETILTEYNGNLPHCEKLKEDIGCQFNKHTNDCVRYRDLLDRHLSPSERELEGEYREWRRNYFSGPGKPSFRYPSWKGNSSPKIFGKDYFQIDFHSSTIKLRLDGMGSNDFISFAFQSWPPDYSPQPDDTEITSVQISFVGKRARIGFRFSVPHKKSRFGVTQDAIDELRSRKYPRQSQDQEFLEEARTRLLDSLQGIDKSELRLLAVDVGTRGAGAALFEGQAFVNTEQLNVVKANKLYAEVRRQMGKGKGKPDAGKSKTGAGLDPGHVSKHLKSMATEAENIASHRKTGEPGELRNHDLRRLKYHVNWMIRDWVRLNASQIIKVAEKKDVDLIVFESLRGFHAPGYDKLDLEKRERLAFFAYGKIRRKVVEKAVERGMRVVTVPYRYTSRICSECGIKQQDTMKWAKNKRKRRFSCECDNCSYEGNSDDNAALVIGKVFWGQIRLPDE